MLYEISMILRPLDSTASHCESYEAGMPVIKGEQYSTELQIMVSWVVLSSHLQRKDATMEDAQSVAGFRGQLRYVQTDRQTQTK